MKCSEVLCLMLPFIIVILFLSIEKDKDKETFGTMEINKPEKEELPEKPKKDEEKTHGFIQSLICATTPIAGDYGCVQRDALLYEK